MTDDVLDGVGARLRALRQERDLTLAELSEGTGISVSTLSRLESGQRKPTLELLLPLARVHQVQLDELVGTGPAEDPRVRGKAIRMGGMTMVPLTRRPGQPAGVQDHDPRWLTPSDAGAEDPRGLRVALRPQRSPADGPR